ncbi:RimK/LysX family protein [Thaumasiovibrio sp. DFM-14]|uniref:putative ATP-dependent zinc protease n=1 Tax=Thaumasiovibrio sp. DFM-14 TaxID=3384792 RepID=UPI00399FFB33
MYYIRHLIPLLATFFSLIACSDNTGRDIDNELALFSHPTHIDDRLVLGRTELVYFNDIKGLDGVGFPAKIDTGADSTSIYAENIQILPRSDQFDGLDGDELIEAIIYEYNRVRKTELRDRDDLSDIMVEFDLRHPHSGELKSYRTELLRVALVKARDTEGFLYRPVVMMPITIAGMTVETEVNLADRSVFSTPILIGKTFLRQHAWVDAGYDYLQLQDNAAVIGRREKATILGMPVNVSISLDNSYSALHAEDIEIDRSERRVEFMLTGNNGKKKKVDLPYVRIVPFSSGERPLVYVPVRLGPADSNNRTEMIQVTLADRSESSTELRLGKETLNRLYFVDMTQEYLADKPLKSIREWAETDDMFVVSPQEVINVDGIDVVAEPALMLKTSVLEVAKLEERTKGAASYTIQGIDDRLLEETSRIRSRIAVGDLQRVTVDTALSFGGLEWEDRLALQQRDSRETEASVLRVSPSMLKRPVLINTRSIDIFNKVAPLQAGYIEHVEMEGLFFPAKLDTGADVSSLSAKEIEIFELDGHRWVNFIYTNSDGAEQKFTRKIVNKMRVKPRPGEEATVRPVVKMTVMMGDVTKTIEVNLRDRSAFDYSLILGRNFLNNNIIVSSDERYIHTGQSR